MYGGRTREQVRAEMEQPAPPCVEELLETIIDRQQQVIDRLDTLIELTKRNRGESPLP
jgi:hypothetical protein